MEFNIKNFLKIFVSIAIACLLVYLILQNVSIDKLIAEIKLCDFRWIIVSIVIALFSHFIRALRWNMLLATNDYYPTPLRSFQAVMVGYIANLAIPRIGEVTKCGVLAKTDDIPVATSLGTVVVERLLDVIMLFLLVGLCLILEFTKLNTYFNDFFNDKLNSSSTGFYLLMIIGIGAVITSIGGYWLYNKFENIAKISLVVKIKSFVKGLWGGLISIAKLKNVKLFLFYTIFIWFLYFLMTYLLFFATPMASNLGPICAFVVMVIGGFGMAAPVQGGIGAYHLLVSGILMLYGLTQENGIIVATILHITQTLAMIVGGLISLITVNMTKSKVILPDTIDQTKNELDK